MRPPCRPHARLSSGLFFLLIGLAGCGSYSGSPQIVAESDPGGAVEPVALEDVIPPAKLDAVLRAHYRGLGFMERYEYGKAAEAFREVHELAPGWIPGSVNLAIALLNDTGTQAEAAKSTGGTGSANFDEALKLLDAVIDRDPDHLNARYCRGLILEFVGRGGTAKAHEDFKFVAERDPADGHAWYKVGATLTAPDDPSQPAGPAQAEELIALYTRALDRNPYLVTALYKLQQAYGWARQRDKQAELLTRWRQLNPKTNAAGPGDTVEAFYGESGKYSRVMNPFPAVRPEAEPARPPKFESSSPLRVDLKIGERWARAQDFTNRLAVLGLARERFGATSVVFDADGDGKSDLFVAAAIVGPKGLRDALLLNKGDGQFEEVSEAWGLTDGNPSLAAAAADFDADRRVDLFVTGLEGNRLLRNVGARFEDVTEASSLTDTKALGLHARWLDLDQDGD
ncbi:MAG: tetratricopeptide repeat protein, partial [Isosphaeraceae bacterium]